MKFQTPDQARNFMAREVDNPVVNRRELLADGLTLIQKSIDVGGGRFTNLYSINVPTSNYRPRIKTLDKTRSPLNMLNASPDISAVSSGGFFFLTDIAPKIPRQSALNLAISDFNVRSLPVSDQEAVLSINGVMSARNLRSVGKLRLNNRELSWSGSKTHHEADVKLFSNGNLLINHETVDGANELRVLDESSCLVSDEKDTEYVNIGLTNAKAGNFSGMVTKDPVDLTLHDLVIKVKEDYSVPISSRDVEVSFKSIDDIPLQLVAGGFSTGPMLDTKSFDDHPINFDGSLGSHPPFKNNRQMARVVLMKMQDDFINISLFDGRPGSINFGGISPEEAKGLVISEFGDPEWACFMDSGQTAKLAIRGIDAKVSGYGNRHYLSYPRQGDRNKIFTWTPNEGRAVASMIVV